MIRSVAELKYTSDSSRSYGVPVGFASMYGIPAATSMQTIEVRWKSDIANYNSSLLETNLSTNDLPLVKWKDLDNKRYVSRTNQRIR